MDEPSADLFQDAKEALRQIIDVSKQLVTLSTAIAAAFVGGVKAGLFSVENDSTFLTVTFFIVSILTVIFAFLLQLMISGTFDAISFPNRTSESKEAANFPSMYRSGIRFMLALMLISFVGMLVSLACIVLY